jgi:hypothetical protein
MIRDHYRLPEDVWGFLDWVTGLVRVNLTSEQFTRSERTEQFELTLNHELFHAFQICTTGYMYRTCMELLREIVRIIISVGESLDLDRLIRTPPPSSSKLDALLTEIDRANNDGITARDLIEGYAYYSHEALHDPALDAASYARRLVAAPGRAYTNAFSYSEQRVAAEAFELFPLLCYLALLFRDPPSVFCRLHDLLLGRCGPTAGKRRRDVVKLLDQIPAEYLGIPCQDRPRYTAPNPFYSWSMQKISKRIGASLLDYAAEPGTIPHDLQEALLRPIILNDLHQIEPHTFHVDSPYSLNATLITAFTSFRILSDHPQGPRMLSLSRPDVDSS